MLKKNLTNVQNLELVGRGLIIIQRKHWLTYSTFWKSFNIKFNWLYNEPGSRTAFSNRNNIGVLWWNSYLIVGLAEEQFQTTLIIKGENSET